MADSTAYPCPRCQIGYYQPGKKTYVRMHRGMLVSIPDMPVWICDICQHEEFDQDAILEVEALLGAGESDPQRSSSKIPSIEIPDPIRRVKS